MSAHSLASAIANGYACLPQGSDLDAYVRHLVDTLPFGELGTGFYFIYRAPINVALPIRHGLQGADLAQNRDTRGVQYVAEMSRQAEAGGGYTTYTFYKPDGSEGQKRAYSARIPGTDLWIGTWIYLDEVQEELLLYVRTLPAFSVGCTPFYTR